MRRLAGARAGSDGLFNPGSTHYPETNPAVAADDRHIRFSSIRADQVGFRFIWRAGAGAGQRRGSAVIRWTTIPGLFSEWRWWKQIPPSSTRVHVGTPTAVVAQAKLLLTGDSLRKYFRQNFGSTCSRLDANQITR